jgi:hypothetical protein
MYVFTVALDGFSFMDIYRWRADCMVQMADILERRGEIIKSVELWKQARPLFQRSSQTKDVAQIDRKLTAVGAHGHEQLQRLAELKVPVGKPEDYKAGPNHEAGEEKPGVLCQLVV